ncbi:MULTISPECIES: LuxR C-terminal-related transcriptional regulator [unclassified Cellulomonas]|uniref:helix-turn-helix transcriptional regulator n=1 Tax=unclassified Cellulomonas TaxID=2620175 RepID=UPI0024B7E97D|nr:LuxR C-terminal-related transcriptional regulator [Cellulomonas sp. ES6]WHP16690.1 LuxR C-terminal-related transcriptional regulator [Cellulomonas sp. ES6]
MDQTLDVAGDALRWLDLGRDVLIRGEEGSGRTTALDDLVRRATAAGTHVLVLRASHVPEAPPLTPVLLHELARTPRSAGRTPLPELVDVLAEELAGRRNVLAVDDLDHLDPATLVVVEELLRRTSCLLAATVDSAVLEGPARRTLAGRAPAEVAVAPLGEPGTAGLLADRLQGPPALALTAALLNQSGGHPAVALALLDAARWSGAAERVDGVWDLVGPLEDAPLDAAVHALTRRLDPGLVDALTLLSWTGPVPAADAAELAGAGRFDELLARGRLTASTADPDGLVLVTPPALAHGLVRRRTPAQARHDDAVVRAHFGTDYSPRPHTAVDPAVPDTLTWQLAAENPSAAWTSATAGLLLDRVSVQRAARRAAWREAPTVRHAVALLDAFSGSPDRALVRDVLAHVERGPDDDPADVARLLEQQAQWSAWAEEDAGALGRTATRLGLPADARTPLAEARELVAAARAAVHDGRPEEALTLLGSAEAPPPEPVRAALEALRTDALLFDGRVEEASTWARTHLAHAAAELDAVSVRAHTSTLAGLQIVSGRGQDAWPWLSVALRLGLPGPFDDPMPLRVVPLGAVVHARAGNLRFAQLLLRELDHRDVAGDPLLRALTAWAEAEAHYARGEVEAGNRLLWEHGLGAAEAGHLTAAMVCWSWIAWVYPPDRLRVVLDRFPADRLSLFAPVVELHRALSEGPGAAVVAAVGGLRSTLGPAQSRVVLDRLTELRAQEGLPPLTASQVSEAAGRPAGHGLDPSVERTAAGADPLSDREREVALLARAGLSNREIAARLFLSVRTVESHMYRALRKLGLAARTDLAADWDPDAG